MNDWADRLASQLVDKPDIIQVWNKSGYCRKCNQPLAGSLIDLSQLKKEIASTLREVNKSVSMID